MKTFWIIFLSSLVPGIVMFVMVGRKDNEKRNSLYYPRGILRIAVLGLFIFLTLEIAAILTNQFSPFVLAGGSIFLAPSIALFVLYFRVQITFFDDFWIFRNKRYSYECITKVVILKDGGYVISFDKKRLAIDRLVVNGQEFYKMLKKKKVLKNAEVIRKDDK